MLLSVVTVAAAHLFMFGVAWRMLRLTLGTPDPLPLVQEDTVHAH